MSSQSLYLTYSTSNRFHRSDLNGQKVSPNELENFFEIKIPRFFNYASLGSLKKELSEKNVALGYDNDFDTF